MKKQLMNVLAGLLAVTVSAVPSRAATLLVPNASFESPATTFVDINIDSWQKSSKPDWYNESGGFTWVQLTGVFRNTSPASPDHIDNCDGNQALWLFAVPEVGLFQDFNSVDWNDPSPTHEFDATFETGKSYHLTVGVIGGGGGMLQGATLELSLYYRDAASNLVIVAATSITNITAIFSNTTHLVDFQVRVPFVQVTAPWAGQHIGIRMLSTVDASLQGGYWDLDHVRLSSFTAPALVNPVRTNGQFKFILRGEPGSRCEILATTNVALPSVNWTSLGVFTNAGGDLPFAEAAANFGQRFYQARQMP